MSRAPGRPRRGRPVESSRARFERRAAEVRQRPLRLVVILGVVVGLLVGVGYLLLGSSSFAAREVRVEGVGGADADAVVAAAQVPLGTPLARLDTGDIAARVEAVPLIRSAAVSRGWPSTVVISVSPREPILAVRGPDGRLTLVDEQLVSFRTVDQQPAGVALVHGPNGSPDQEALQTVAAVLRLLPTELRATVTEITLSSASLVTFKLGQVQVVWGGAGQEQKKLAVLQALLATQPAVIDVSAPDTPITR